MNDQPPLEWLRVEQEAQCDDIPDHITEHGVNQRSKLRDDKHGNPVIILGVSQDGEFQGNRAAIWFRNETLASAGIPIVDEALGQT